MAGVCSVNTVIEADGSMYPCDFYVLDQWNLGNITQDDFSSLKKKDRALQFVNESYPKNKECVSCSYLKLCRSGCKRHYVQNGTISQNYFCSSYKEFYSHAYERLREIAQLVRYYKKI
ncbi:SPASM domain-containing protein [Proteiniclasticum sp. C24MP]|uniref:SPASM domain-containing protein n=1 Tax=Proteiniclasticum sp. C24MP TaxID=3374101 RepID=UPI003754D5D6